MMPSLVVKFFRYFATGGLAAVVDTGGFYLILTFGAPTAVGAITSWLAAALVNYLLTSYFVFAQRATRDQSWPFCCCPRDVRNVSVTLAGVEYLLLQPAVAKILGIGLAFLINFTLNVRVVFSSCQVD